MCVCPAQAGIYLLCGGDPLSLRGLPRPGGDLPSPVAGMTNRSLFAPPRRGSTPVSLLPLPLKEVCPACAGGRTNFRVHTRSPRDCQDGQSPEGPKTPTEKQARDSDRKAEATHSTNSGPTLRQARGVSRSRKEEEQDHGAPGAPGVPPRPGPRGTAASDCTRTLRGLPLTGHTGPDPVSGMRRATSGEPTEVAGAEEDNKRTGWINPEVDAAPQVTELRTLRFNCQRRGTVDKDNMFGI